MEQLITLTRDFLRARADAGSSSWRVWEVPSLRPDLRPMSSPGGETQLPLGVIGGAASVSVPLAFLSADQAETIHQVAAGGPVVVTPWRGLLIPGAASALDRLAECGLVVDDLDVWSQISACVGAPGCAKSRISTADLARALSTRQLDRPVHVTGCERRCGAPAGGHDELIAPADLGQALRQLGLTR